MTINMSCEVYKRVNYVQIIFNYFMMQSLAAYILILTSKYEKNKSELTKKVDMWINIVLFVTRATSNVSFNNISLKKKKYN